MKMKKGQAAMEYLMTYGWAILAIIIVIAALIYLNPFSAPELCLFQQQGFSCSEPQPQVYLNDQGEVMMNVRIWNKLGKSIEIKRVFCTTAQTSEVDSSNSHVHVVPGDDGHLVPTGSYMTFSGDPNAHDTGIACYNADDNELQLAPNQEFRGRLIVWYNYENDLDKTILHESQANVISLVVE
ncbi:hypothetical protein JW721_06045 [Candidatus Micrarchaeota archaeon]|nr:hypothetical protein [Candidatus Micrarchaeota archaeon]